MVQRDWTLSCEGKAYQLDRQHEAMSLVGRQVIVRKLRTGAVQIVYRGAKLRYRPLPARPQRSTPSPKPVITKVPKLKATATHPWRRFASGIGKGRRFWKEQKRLGRAVRRQLLLGNSSRPSLRSGLPTFPSNNCTSK